MMTDRSIHHPAFWASLRFALVIKIEVILQRSTRHRAGVIRSSFVRSVCPPAGSSGAVCQPARNLSGGRVRAAATDTRGGWLSVCVGGGASGRKEHSG